MRPWIIALGLALAVTTFAGSASAATRCKDATGKFIKCPPAAAASAAPAASAKASPKATPKATPMAASLMPVSPKAASPKPATASVAARCKDATGKFIRCPSPAAAPLAGHCRDIKTGRFAKCGTPGTKPA